MEKIGIMDTIIFKDGTIYRIYGDSEHGNVAAAFRNHNVYAIVPAKETLQRNKKVVNPKTWEFYLEELTTAAEAEGFQAYPYLAKELNVFEFPGIILGRRDDPKRPRATMLSLVYVTGHLTDEYQEYTDVTK